MKKTIALVLALLGWFAVIAQYFLMIENRIASVAETTIRFFSFFTILTNTIVAIYFTSLLIAENRRPKLIDRPGTLTAITVYITVVCLIYQIVLRHIWNPQGLQMIVDELLHTIIPLLVIIVWYLYEIKAEIQYRQIFAWLIYPLVYMIYIFARGYYSKFYPYPFTDVSKLGLSKVLINSALLLFLFVGISALFVFVGKSIKNKNKN